MMSDEEFALAYRDGEDVLFERTNSLNGACQVEGGDLPGDQRWKP
jgi:hypothetical protein